MENNSCMSHSNTDQEDMESMFPLYSEIQHQIIDLVLSLKKDHLLWLDTGCRTGALVREAAKVCPVSEFVLCDPSRPLLQSARRALASCPTRCSFYPYSSQRIPYRQRFDVVTAVQAHLHLSMQERIFATKNCFTALKPGGMYITVENFAPATVNGTQLLLNRWRQFQIKMGKSPEEAKRQTDCYGKENLPITTATHLFLLRQCGFSTVELFWLSHLQAGFFALKPPV